MIYFDTSYLVRLYYEDADWGKVRELAAGEHLACAWHGQAEVLAAFHRKLRERAVKPAHYAAMLGQFTADSNAGAFQWLPLAQDALGRVARIFRILPPDVYLRAADALHLAAAAENGHKVIYSHDAHLLTAAPFFGLAGRDVIGAA